MRTPDVYLIGKPHDPEKAIFMGGQPSSEPIEEWHPLWHSSLDRFRLAFLIMNVSRAFQQQLTRHRLDFSFSIQSLRMVDVGTFAEDGAYHKPERLLDGCESDVFFRDCILYTQKQYRGCISRDFKVEDARGVLPLNIHSTLTFSCTFGALKGLLGQRLCHATQGEFQSVARQIKTLVEEWHPRFGAMLQPHCFKTMKCLMHREDCPRVKAKTISLQATEA